MSSLYSLLYVSTAASEFSENEIAELLTAARTKNEERNITGVLVFSMGHFFQYLEGPCEAVIDTFRKIEIDLRHINVTQMFAETTPARQFGEFSMAYKMVPEDAVNGDPFGSFLRKDDRNVSRVEHLIKVFGLYM